MRIQKSGIKRQDRKERSGVFDLRASLRSRSATSRWASESTHSGVSFRASGNRSFSRSSRTPILLSVLTVHFLTELSQTVRKSEIPRLRDQLLEFGAFLICGHFVKVRNGSAAAKRQKVFGEIVAACCK